MSNNGSGRDAQNRRERKLRLVRLLHEALDLADSLGLSPEVGARLQEVIDLTEASSGTDLPS